MPQVEAGMFLIMLGIALVALLMSFKLGTMLKAVSAILFFVLSIMMFADYDVVYTNVVTGGACSPTCTETKYLINENQSWLAWVFVILGIFSALMFSLELMGG